MFFSYPNILGVLYTALLKVQAFCPWMAELRKHVTGLEVLSCRPVFHGGGASAVVYFKTRRDLKEVENIVKSMQHITGASFSKVGKGGWSVGIVTSLFCPCTRLGIPNVHILRIGVEGDWLIFQLVFHDLSEFAEVTERLKNMGVRYVFEKPKRFKAGLLLTPRQEEVLIHAYLNGYFRNPRPATVNHLARKLGVSTPTYTETLRRALAKLAENVVFKHGPSKLKLPKALPGMHHK